MTSYFYALIVTSQFPIQATQIFYSFLTCTCVPPFEKGSATHDHTHAKRTIIRKKLQAKFKYVSIEQNRKYLHRVVITKTDRKSNL